MINQRERELWQEFLALPGSAQETVAELITSLKTKTTADSSAKKIKNGFLSDDPFIGLWQDRTDLADSTQWVRDLRASEW